jgi:hypothetical protein
MQAKRLLERKFTARWGKGDHLLFFNADGNFIFGLAVCSGSNKKALPPYLARQVKQLLEDHQ